MPTRRSKLLNQLSTADLKRLLAARERIDTLETERTKLARELARVDKELEQLLAAGAEGKARRGRPRKAGKKATATKTAKKTAKKTAGRKKTARKKAARKATTAKKTVRKTTARKTSARKASGGKKVGRKKTARGTTTRKKTARKTTARKTYARRATGVRLEDVIADVIRAAGGPVAVADLKRAILDGKLFATKSKNFDNVLRRTLSTSKSIKRAGRGIYDLA